MRKINWPHLFQGTEHRTLARAERALLLTLALVLSGLLQPAAFAQIISPFRFIRLTSVTPAKQRVHDIITLRGSGFGKFDPASRSKVLFAKVKNVAPVIEAGAPYVWRDDFIQVRVPVGNLLVGGVQRIPTGPIVVWVRTASGRESNICPFFVIVRPCILIFKERTNIVADEDVSTFLGSPNLNLNRTKDAEFGDVNGDGFPDLLDNASNNIFNRTHGVLRTNRLGVSFAAIDLEPNDALDAGTFATTVPVGGDFVADAVIYDSDLVDLNNDRLPDLVQCAARDAGTANRLRVLINNNGGVPGQFIEDSSAWIGSTTFDGCPDDICHTDLNYDGFLDVATSLRTAHGGCGGPTGTALIFLNNAGLTFDPPITVSASVGVSSHDVFFLDGDHDGFMDVFLVNENGLECQLFLHDNNDPPAFILSQTFAFNAFAGQTADFNGDGYADFALARSSSASVFINDVTSPGTFIEIALPDVPFGTYDLEMGDINLDGTVDIVGASITSTADDTVRIWTNDGNAVFTNITSPGASTILPGIGPYQRLSVDLLDFDMDGDLDLYIAGADGQDVGPGSGFGRVPNQFYENKCLSLHFVIAEAEPLLK